MLKLSRPIAFFDLETTGVKTTEAKIVSIAVRKIHPDGEAEEKYRLINPGEAIPAEATAVHGITDEMVEKMPTFKQVAKGLYEFMIGCDFGGYNSNRFDVPVLMEEFARCGINWPPEEDNTAFVDAYQIEKDLNGHTLAQTYNRYTGKTLDDAHDAKADNAATVEVLFGQLEAIGEAKTPQELAQIGKKENQVDIAGYIVLQDGVAHWGNFGKNKHQPLVDDKQYCDWVLRADFPVETKRHITKILAQDEA